MNSERDTTPTLQFRCELSRYRYPGSSILSQQPKHLPIQKF
jgi:hypothetical protein